MPRRVDAERNRTRLIEAAHDVFLREGISAPLDHVRLAAEVGRATLYRHFPDRAALIEALLDRSFCRIETLAEGRSDPMAFFDLLCATVEEVRNNCTLYDFWRERASDPAAVARLQDRLEVCFQTPLANAQAAGFARDTLNARDLVLAFRMIGTMLSGEAREEREALATRALGLISNGLLTSEGQTRLSCCPIQG